MIITISIILVILIICIAALFVLKQKNDAFGSLSGNRIYSDSPATPGEILRATTLNLVGKPDYILHTKDGIIPVEVKTGKSPASPYQSHVMQLMAYCLLVEEHFKSRPPGGIIRYQQTGTEFKVAYTKEAENAVRQLVKEIAEKKATGEEMHCNHPEHNTQ